MGEHGEGGARAEACPSLAPFRVSVLGGVSVAGRRRLSHANAKLLAILVAAGPRGLGTVELAASLGLADNDTRALRMAVSRLRGVLPEGVLPSGSGAYRLELDADDVDAWFLASGRALREVRDVATDRLEHLLRFDDRWASRSEPRIVEESDDETARCQRELLCATAAARPELLRSTLLDDAVRHLERDRFDERLLLAVLTVLRRAGERRRALNVISGAASEFADIGLGLPAGVQQLESELLAELDGSPAWPDHPPAVRHVAALSGDETLPAPALRQTRALPEQFERLLGDTYFGTDDLRARVLAMLDADRCGISSAAVVGPIGAGKTRLLAEVANAALQRSWHVVSLLPTELSAGAMAAFTAAIPDLHRKQLDGMASWADSETRKAALWSAAQASLLNVEQPTLLLIDDAQWLDSQSHEFVEYLLTVTTPARVAVVVAARPVISPVSRWRAVSDSLRRAGAPVFELRPFDPAHMLDFVTSRLNVVGIRARRLAAELHRLSAGWPGAASILADIADPETGRLPLATDQVQALASAWRERDISPPVIHVGAVIASLGGEADVWTVAKVAELDLAFVVEAIDDLVRHGLLVARTPMRFATPHALVDAALIGPVPKVARRRWHQLAADLPGRDVHMRAKHLSEAIPLVDPMVAHRASLDSGRLRLEEGLAYEAVESFTQAERYAPVTGDDLVGYTRALDLTGQHRQAEARREAGIRALLPDRAGLALRLAVSGLPESEPIDGASRVITSLRMLPECLPTATDAWDRARHMARQLAIAGELTEARHWARTAQSFARTPSEHISAAVLQRLVLTSCSPPTERLAALSLPYDVVDLADDALTAEVLLLRAIDSYEAGDLRASEAARRGLDQLRLGALRRWHAALFDAMVASDRDDGASANVHRELALTVAGRGGLREADHAHLIGMFCDLFAQGQEATLYEFVNGSSIDAGANTVMRAAVSAVRFASGDRRSLDGARSVVHDVVRSPVSQGLAAIAIVADAVAGSGDRELSAIAHDLIAQRGPSFIVLGAGAASFGPADRYRAKLTDDWTEKEALLRSASRFSTRLGATRWERACERDLDALHSRRPHPGRKRRASRYANLATQSNVYVASGVAATTGPLPS